MGKRPAGAALMATVSVSFVTVGLAALACAPLACGEELAFGVLLPQPARRCQQQNACENENDMPLILDFFICAPL